MSGHLTPQSVELYQQQRLPAKELLEADAHLSRCASCRDQLKERARMSRAILAFRSGLELEAVEGREHPSYEQFTSYVEGRLDEVDVEIMDSHLFVCEECSQVMKELRAFAAVPATSPVADQLVAKPAPSFLYKLRQFWHARTPWTMPMGLAGAAAALLLLTGISAGLWYAFTRPSAGTEVVRLNPQTENAPTPQPTQAVATSAPTPDAVSNINASTNRPETPAQTAQTQNTQAQSAQQRTANRQASTDVPAVALKDGDRVITLDAGGNVSGLEALSSADRQAVRKALVSAKVETPSVLASMLGSVAVLRGGSTEGISFPILNPVGTVVAADRPTLRWGKLDKATSYVASVFDRNFRRVAVSQPQTGTEWTVTAPLARGEIYTWQVTATRDGQEIISPRTPAPEVRFMVLEAAKAEEIRRAEQNYRGAHLTLGTLYARAGLLDEAEREFQMFLRDNPESSLARRLLESVRAIRNTK